MQIVDEYITLSELEKMSEKMFGKLVKAVIDLEKEIMVVDAEMHSDEEELLLERGSNQANLWGINLHPDAAQDKFIEFDSMINMRPSWGNPSRYVENAQIREKIKVLVNKLVKKC